MTVPSSGDRFRRGGRRPGWTLLTALLVLAITASSALVFTSRVELLKLAVILSLWAAVVAAFVSVMYRRQSDVDAARARDLKLVYDLQLDREISARREYELTVEADLRRELAGEMRAQSFEEVAALRAELAALRRNLEIMFDADLEHRPAIETDRSYPEWPVSPTLPRPDRVASSRITDVAPEDHIAMAESPIIDVPEEPLVMSPPRPQVPAADEARRGFHRGPSEISDWIPPVQPVSEPAAPGRFRAPDHGPPQAHAVHSHGAASPAEPQRQGRHSSPPEPVAGRHTVPASRHSRAEDDTAVTTGHSVAELLARLQRDTGGGGRRRRRED